jgi:16S rRNA processing protein RimM
MTAADPAVRVAVGRITRAHGIHGFVAVLPLTDVAERFDPGSTLLVGAEGDRVAVIVERRGQEHRPLVRFEGVPDRDAAERLAGEYLFVPASVSPALPEGEYWPHQLLGLRAVTDGGADLGTVREILTNVANDIWVARSDDGAETLIPALKDVILSVDLAARVITVAEIEGLTVPERPAGPARPKPS